MYRRRWPSVRRALLAGLVVWAFATQLEPTTSLNIQAVLENASEGQVATIDNARHAPPAPAALTKAITSTDQQLASRNSSRSRQEPNGITDTASNSRSAFLRPAPADKDEALPWVRVDGSVVNVRSGPRASAERIGRYPEGTRLRVIERGEKWTKIKEPETGQSGWMYGDYLAGITSGSEPAS